jgi:hypothetical protein
MGSSFRGPHGKYRVEQENSLACPSLKRTILLKGNAKIILYLLIYIFSREGGGWTPCGTEKERP